MFVHLDGATALWEPLNDDQLPGLGPAIDQPWGLREFFVVDPDGNGIRLGPRRDNQCRISHGSAAQADLIGRIYRQPVTREANSEATSSVTTAEVADNEEVRRGRAGRRAVLVVLALIVLLGLTGMLGVHTSTVTTTAAGYRLSVDYARVSRAGLDTPWTVTVTAPGGFSGPITLATTAEYFTIFETQGFSPEPTSESESGGALYQTFEPPDAATSFSVAYDAYVQPAAQLGKSARTTLIVGNRQISHVDYRTWLVP